MTWFSMTWFSATPLLNPFATHPCFTTTPDSGAPMFLGPASLGGLNSYLGKQETMLVSVGIECCHQLVLEGLVRKHMGMPSACHS